MTTSRVLLISAGVEQTTIITNPTYHSVGNSALDTLSATSTQRQILYRTPGVMSQLYVRVIANGINGDSTITVRNNGTLTALTVTIGPNAVGVFEDTTHQITIAAGDKLDYRFLPGAATGSLTLAVLAVAFDTVPNTTTVTRVVCGGQGTTFAGASLSRYNCLCGEITNVNASENIGQARIRTACVGKNLAVNVSANARTTDTTFRMRKNGANGNMSIPVSTLLTGWFEDTTHSDTLAVGDDYNSVVETLTGTESLTVRSICVDMETTTSQGFLINSRTTGNNQNANTTSYYSIAGSPNASTTENNRKVKALDTFRISDLTLLLSTNTVTAPSTLTLRKNGVDTALAITIPASTADLRTNSTDSVLVTANDELSLAVVTGATGTVITIRTISLTAFGYTARVPTLAAQTELIAEQRARQKAAWRLQP